MSPATATYLLPILNLSLALPKKTANKTTANNLQQLIKLTIVKDVRIITKLINTFVTRSTIDNFIN